MLHYEWLRSHKKEILFLLAAGLILMLCLIISDFSRDRYLVKEDKEIVAVQREDLEQALSLPMEIELEKDGKQINCEVVLNLKGPADVSDLTGASTVKEEQESISVEETITALTDEIERQTTLQIPLPNRLEDGTRLRWKRQHDLRFLLIFLLLPACLLYIYEAELQQEQAKRKRYEDEIRRGLPSFVDQILLLLNCGLIFHDAFCRIKEGYAARSRQDAFSRLISRIWKEAEETGSMVITVMKRLSQEAAVREYVRMVNILTDHQHRGVNLEDKLQEESRLLWEGRKAASIQKGREMETKMTFPLALLLGVLIIIAGTPALMNM